MRSWITSGNKVWCLQIQHQYRLTNEQGPAHKKRFTVTLKLGDEEYSAEGASIKKAQHSAASEALQHTQYKHPPPKTQRNIRLGKSKYMKFAPGYWLHSPQFIQTLQVSSSQKHLSVKCSNVGFKSLASF
jgi:dsRNA-specific ribonuclease